MCYVLLQKYHCNMYTITMTAIRTTSRTESLRSCTDVFTRRGISVESGKVSLVTHISGIIWLAALTAAANKLGEGRALEGKTEKSFGPGRSCRNRRRSTWQRHTGFYKLQLGVQLPEERTRGTGVERVASSGAADAPLQE